MTEINILTSDFRRQMLIDECDEKLADLRRECPGVTFEIAKNLNHDGNHPHEIEDAYYVRESISAMLNSVQSSLPKGLRLLICCGYRTPDVQDRQYKTRYNKMKLENPSWDKETLEYEIEKSIDPPDVGPHCTGGAVDLSLIDENGNQVDMGTYVDEFNRKAYTRSNQISKTAEANRQVLIVAMEKAGFLNFPTEWWHWSYGDREWAHANNTEAFYGPIEQRSDDSDDDFATGDFSFAS